MSSTHSPLTCPACRAIDQADGVEDGNLFPVFIKRIGNERTILASVAKTNRLLDESSHSIGASLV